MPPIDENKHLEPAPLLDGLMPIVVSCTGSTSCSVAEPTFTSSSPTFSVFGINTYNAKASDVAPSVQNDTEAMKEKSKLRLALNSVLSHTQIHLTSKLVATRVANGNNR